MPSRSLDAARIKDWTGSLIAGDVDPLQREFQVRGARGPEIIWDPDPAVLRQPQLRFMLEHWRRLAGRRDMPCAREIDALALRPALGFVSLVDVIDGGGDFRYRLAGTILTAVSGFDMTRRLLSEHRASDYFVEYFFASYRAAIHRRQPLYTEHSPPAAVMTNAWHRLTLPLGDETGAIGRFLVGNVAVGYDGRPINITL